MYLSAKPDRSPSPVEIVKSHGNKCQNYFFVWLATWNVAKWDAREERYQEKDYCEEYLYPAKYYYGSVKKSKFSFSWHLQIDEKSVIWKKIKEENWFKL